VSELIRLALSGLTSLAVLDRLFPSSSASRRLARRCSVAFVGSSPSSLLPNRSSLHVFGSKFESVCPSGIEFDDCTMSFPLLRVRIVRPMHHVETSPLASVTRACEVPLLTRMSPGSTQRGAQDSRGKGRDQALRQVKPNASTQQGSVETDKKTTTTEETRRASTKLSQTRPPGTKHEM